MEIEKKTINPFDTIPDMTFEEYRNQDVIVVNDGEFFDALDEMFGIEPGTDNLISENEE